MILTILDNVIYLKSNYETNQKKEMLIITAMSIPLMYIAVNFDLLEKLYYFSRKYEEYEIDENIRFIIICSIYLILL